MLLFLFLSLLLLSSSHSSTAPSPGKAQESCLYFSRQADHQVLVYNTIPNPRHPAKLKLEAGTDIASFSVNPFPTGLAIHGDLIYVASYGNATLKAKHENQKKLSPRIEVFSTQTLTLVSTLVDDENLHGCYPEDLSIADSVDGPILLVGCGVNGKGILKYSLKGKYLGALAEGDCCSAVWGIVPRDGFVYFSNHCTGVRTGCSRQKQDKIFRVPLNGGPSDVQVFASLEGKPKGLKVGGFGDLDFGPDGNLYVTSLPNEDVLVFNPFGGFIKKLDLHKVENPVSLQFHNGKAYVSDPNRGRILEVSVTQDNEASPQIPFAVPGPILNSKLMYLAWGPCPLPEVQDVPATPEREEL